MALSFLKIPQRTTGRYPDELQDYMEAKGRDRHSPVDLADTAADYGAVCHFTTKTTIEEVKAWLSTGNPCVVHGYFTDSGHIIALTGFDEYGFYVHDPYGEWSSDGYDRNDEKNFTKGKLLHYSYEMMRETSITDEEFWVHFLRKPVNP